MKIHFIGSASGLQERLSLYETILGHIQKCGGVIVNNWVSEAKEDFLDTYSKKTALEESADWDKLYRENVQSVLDADAIVAEVSNKTFFVGFQVAQALQLKKPILVLSDSYDVSSVLGIDNAEEELTHKVYTASSLRSDVELFMADQALSSKSIRFNMFITKRNLNYLNKKSNMTGKTKSEIVRELLELDGLNEYSV